MRILDLTGQVFGQWTVLGLHHERTKVGQSKWLCRCACGTERPVAASNLKSGGSTGCGHDKGDRIRASKEKHGAFSHGKWHPLYNSWQAMHSRCSNPKNVEYARYGASGVTVCPQWADFGQFARDMGPKPTPQHTIDRINNALGYEPGNCRWATKKEQSENRTTNRMHTRNGVTQSLSAWARDFGMTKAALYARLRRGMTVDDALDTPLIPKGKYVRAPRL